MIYTESYQVRWHDTDFNLIATPSALLTFMQETANHHLDSMGMPLDEIRDTRGVGFILSKLAMQVYTDYGQKLSAPDNWCRELCFCSLLIRSSIMCCLQIL